MKPERNPKKMFKVLSCVIYKIIRNYVCIDYLGSDNFLKSDLRLGPGGSYKYFNKSYDNVLGFGIPDLLMNLLSCHRFLKNNDSVVISAQAAVRTFGFIIYPIENSLIC